VQAGERRSSGIESVRALAALAVLWSDAFALSRGLDYSTYGRRLALGGAYRVDLFFVLSGYMAAVRDLHPRLLQRHARPCRRAAAVARHRDAVLLVLPLLAWGLARASGRSRRTAALLLAALGAASLIARQVITWHTSGYGGVHWLDRAVLVLGFFFVLGMGVALARLELEQTRPGWLDGFFGHSSVWIVAAIALWAIACYRLSWELAAGAAGALIVGVLVLPLRHGRLIAPSRWRALALIGVVSYGVYLWHLPILVAVSNRSLSSTTPVAGRGLVELLGIGVPLTLLVAGLTYWLIERRGLAHRRRWSTNTPPHEAPERHGSRPSATDPEPPNLRV
jgi:peptidoglycan/LPS O-acetylase OafA/YrhL